MMWLLAVGLVSMLGQVVLLRELHVALYGSELAYVLALGVWLLGTAIGAAAGRRTQVPSSGRIRLLLLIWSLVLPLAVAFTRGERLLLGGVPGAYLAFPKQLLAMGLALLPVSALLGYLFQEAAKRFVLGTRTLAGAYAIESVGGILGGILATLLLMAGARNLAALILCSLLAVIASLHPWRRKRPSWLLPVAAVTGGILAAALAANAGIDRWMTSWNHPGLAEVRDTPYGRITITRAAGQISVFESDALVFESQGTATEEFVHLAAIQHPDPKTVLVLGGSMEGLTEEVLRHQPERVDHVELDPVLLNLASGYLPRRPEPPSESRVTLTLGDPRSSLGAERNGYRYDLILIGMPEPGSAQTNRFYTREFFTQCAARLASDGVVALRLPGAENLLTPQAARRLASIYHSLHEVFSDVVILPGPTTLLFASPGKLERDPEVLADRLLRRHLEARRVVPQYVRYLYENDRFRDTASLVDRTPAPANTDLRPICYQYTLLIWLSKFFPVLSVLDFRTPTPGSLLRSPFTWGVVTILAIGILLCQRRESCSRFLLVSIAGFAAMVLEIALILNYQTRSGALYQDLGLLLTLFMAGLALGAAALDRLNSRTPGGPGRRTGLVLFAALAGLSLLSGLLLREGVVVGIPVTAVLLVASGSLTAAAFAYASLRRSPDQGTIVSPLYAADLIGGCLGSLAASLFLIPALGIDVTVWALAGVALLGLAFV